MHARIATGLRPVGGHKDDSHIKKSSSFAGGITGTANGIRYQAQEATTRRKSVQRRLLARVENCIGQRHRACIVGLSNFDLQLHHSLMNRALTRQSTGPAQAGDFRR